MGSEELFMMDKKLNIMKAILEIIKNMVMALRCSSMASSIREPGKMIILFHQIANEYYYIFILFLIKQIIYLFLTIYIFN